MIKRVLILFLFVFVVSCSPNPEEIASFVQQTVESIPSQTAFPTYTAQPTFTNVPTQSPYPTLTAIRETVIVTETFTPTPKFTSTVTFTPTVTSTPTRTPTNTATPNKTQTQQAIINATKGADATATKVAKNAQATEIAKYEQIDYKELVTYADSHVGERVWVKGRIFNINSNTELQMWLGYTRDAVYIVMRDPFSGIYEDNWITVYGTVLGETCGTNAFGGEVCQPVLVDAFYVKN